MQGNGPPDYLPLWILLVAFVLVTSLAVEAGYRLGGWRHRRSEDEKAAPVGSIVGTTLSLLAFMLAFTFGLAAARYDARRGAVLEEASAIGTAYVRAEMLPEPDRTTVHRLLRDYVDVRVEGVKTGDLMPAIRKSEELHDRLWSYAVAAAEKRPGAITSLFVQSLNQVIDLHSKRVMVGLRSRIPRNIWTVLYLQGILSMASLGYYTGLAGSRRSLATSALILTLSAVLWLIADLDRPREGALTADQQPMIDLRQSMTAPTTNP